MQKQKLIFIKYFLMALSIMIVFVSCQKAYVKVKEPDKSLTISVDDSIVDLILRVVLNDNDDLSDDDIECIDFVYPVKLSLYNTEYQKTDFITANNDYDIYNIFSALNNYIVEFDFPITMETLDSVQISVNNNIELENEINNAIGSCEEDDDIDFNQADSLFYNLLTSENWEVALYSDTTDETSSFNSYVFDFMTDQDHTVQADTGSGIMSGTWELMSDTAAIVEIDFDTDKTPLVWLNHGWKIKNKSTSSIEMEAESDFEGYIKKLTLIKHE